MVLSRAVLPSVLIALAATLGFAQAQQPARPGQPPLKGDIKPGEVPLTRDQLRACMNQRDDIQKRTADAAGEQNALNALRDKVRASGAALEEARATVDPKNAEAVAVFTKMATDHDAGVDEYNARVRAFNATIARLDADRGAYRNDCADRPYSEMDEGAIMKERRQAAGKK